MAKVAKKQRETGQAIIYVYVEKLKPTKSRLVNLRIEIENA